MMINPIGPGTAQNVIDYGQYNSPRTSKVITTTREYDTDGNLVKETVIETVYDSGSYTTYQPGVTSGGYICKSDDKTMLF